MAYDHNDSSSTKSSGSSDPPPEAAPKGGDDTHHKKKSACLLFQYFYSTLLLIFCFVLITGSIFTRQTRLSKDVNAAVAFIVLILGVSWLTMVEGGQGATVGLAPVERELYKDTHPKTYSITKHAHKGNNLDRYLLGRQLMVILIVFAINLAGEAIEDVELWGLPGWLTSIFLASGISMVLFTNMAGQLNSEINSCHCMLDYLNNWFAVFTFWVAMAIEWCGILHTSYLIQLLVGKIAGKPVESKEPPRTAGQNVFFWGRCLLSLVCLGFAFAVTLAALFSGYTKMWDSVPAGASVAIFFILLCVVGNLEAMQIAYFAVTKLQKCEREKTYFARKTCKLLFENKAHGLAAFVIGRQLSVVTCMFFIARITSVHIEEHDENIWGVSDGLQAFFSTGLLGALIVTIIGSISWRLAASAFPLFFVNNPVVYIFLRICLFLEMTGVCSGAWVLAAIHKKISGFQRDEIYIGTAEERAAKGVADVEDEEHSVNSAHMYPVAPPPTDPMTLEYLNELELELGIQDQTVPDSQANKNLDVV